jgi:hypothetical protein
MKKQCCIDSLAMVAIIIPNVLSFLTDGDECSDVIGNDDGSSSDGSDSDSGIYSDIYESD